MDLSTLLDDVSSTRSTWYQRGHALGAVEQLMASICGPRGLKNAFHAFIMLQDTFESNVASRLIAALASWLPILQESLHGSNDSKPLDPDAEPAVLQPIMQALSILQGVALLHEPSKAFLGRRWCIQLFLDFISTSKHIPISRDASNPTPLTDDGLLPASSNLASSVLDTLLCALVDTPKATRCFEEVGGLDVLVRTLKRPGVSRDVRMKCLEFLYFYLLPEGSSVTEAIIPDGTPTRSRHNLDGPSHPITPRGPKLPTPPTTSSELSSSLSSDVPFDDDKTFEPNPKVAELRMLRRDIDFVPVTPIKKGQVADLGLGSPFKIRGPTAPSKTPTKKKKHDAQSAITPSSSSSSLEDVATPIEPRTPRREHLRGRSDVTLVNSHAVGRSSLDIPSASQDNIPRTPTKVSRHSPATPIRLKNPSESKLKTPDRLHTRGSSMTEATLVGNPMVNPKKVGLLSLDMGSLQSKGDRDLTTDSSGLRSTAEKTVLLGNYLGNVGALVEGMKKAGAWGLE